MYFNGNGVQQDYHKAMEYYLKSAKQKNSHAQNNIGIPFFQWSIINLSLFTGNMYFNGNGVQQDYHKAMEYFLESANQKNSHAQSNIGILAFLVFFQRLI